MRRIIFSLIVILLLFGICASIIFLLYREYRDGTLMSRQEKLPPLAAPAPAPAPSPPPLPPTIRLTSHGPVEGIEEESVLGQKYYAFRGIPYASPPITGIDPYTSEKVDRRFKAPEPLKYNWSEVKKVHEFQALCPAVERLPYFYRMYNYSEDCLFLNIFVPAGGADKKPVLVNIHGLGIDGGSRLNTLLAPDLLLSQDNVVVLMQYRVLMFGFLNLGFNEYSGNMGLKDQQLGLKWIHENIERFSGNKDAITILGGSIGATFVHAHTINEESRKYFTRAFISSGTITIWNLAFMHHKDNIQRCLGIMWMDEGDLLEYLKSAHINDLMGCAGLSWPVSLESPNAVRPFLTKTPKEIYTSDKPPVLDMMFVTASHESIQFDRELLELKWPWPYAIDLPFKYFSKFLHPIEYEQAIEIVANTYYSDVSTIKAIRDANIRFRSDIMIRENLLRIVMRQADANNNSTDKSKRKNTFLLRYSMHTEFNVYGTFEKQNYTEAAHSDDLCHYFYCRFLGLRDSYQKHLKSKDEVYDIIMRWVTIITNFARYGDPSIEGDTPFKSCLSSEEIYCQEISNNPKSRVTTDIRKQFHYDDCWSKINDIYQTFKYKLEIS